MPTGCAQRPVPASGYSPGPRAVYVVHSLPAGFPSPAADYTTDPLDLNQYLVDRVACTFLFDVSGWSMRLAGIYDGDKVVERGQLLQRREGQCRWLELHVAALHGSSDGRKEGQGVVHRSRLARKMCE